MSNIRVIQGQQLRQLRQARNLDQTRLAVQVGLSQTAISDIELGRFAPNPAIRERLAAVLGPAVWQIDWPEEGYPLELHNQRQPLRAPEGSPGDKLKELRLSQGLSQAGIALQLGITEQKYGRLERGYSKQPDATILQKLAQVLGPTVLEIFPKGK